MLLEWKVAQFSTTMEAQSFHRDLRPTTYALPKQAKGQENSHGTSQD
jgi:hypothetical protein